MMIVGLVMRIHYQSRDAITGAFLAEHVLMGIGLMLALQHKAKQMIILSLMFLVSQVLE